MRWRRCARRSAQPIRRKRSRARCASSSRSPRSGTRSMPPIPTRTPSASRASSSPNRSCWRPADARAKPSCPAAHLQVDSQVMLSFDIRSLEDQAATVDGELSATDPIWIEGDMRPESAVHATGRLSVAGPGRYYWSGAIEGTATVPCRRCLTDTTVKVAEGVHVLYAEAGDEIDDPEVYVLPPRARTIDLSPAVRE